MLFYISYEHILMLHRAERVFVSV